MGSKPAAPDAQAMGKAATNTTPANPGPTLGTVAAAKPEAQSISDPTPKDALTFQTAGLVANPTSAPSSVTNHGNKVEMDASESQQPSAGPAFTFGGSALSGAAASQSTSGTGLGSDAKQGGSSLPAFTFGSAAAPKSEVPPSSAPTPSFTFGSSSQATTQQSAPAFTFGSAPATGGTTSQSLPAFSFAAGSSPAAGSSQPLSTAPVAQSAPSLTFGSTPAPSSTPGFTFGPGLASQSGQPGTQASSAAAAGFTFGSQLTASSNSGPTSSAAPQPTSLSAGNAVSRAYCSAVSLCQCIKALLLACKSRFRALGSACKASLLAHPAAITALRQLADQNLHLTISGAPHQPDFLFLTVAQYTMSAGGNLSAEGFPYKMMWCRQCIRAFFWSSVFIRCIRQPTTAKHSVSKPFRLQLSHSVKADSE